jgi:hypothetical protein
MGISSSKFSSCDITRSCGVYVAGSKIYGSIQLTVKPGQTVDISESRLRIIGDENTEHRENGAGKNKKKRTWSDRKVFFEASIGVFQQRGEIVLREGRHEFPFVVELPAELPGTHTRGLGNFIRFLNNEGSISYFLHLELKDTWTTERNFFSIGNMMNNRTDVRTQEVIIRSIPKPTNLAARTAEPVHVSVAGIFSCCLNRGFISIGASVTNPRAYPGQSFVVHVCVVNQSLSQIHSVEIELVGKFTVNCRGIYHGQRVYSTHKIKEVAEMAGAQRITKEMVRRLKARPDRAVVEDNNHQVMSRLLQREIDQHGSRSRAGNSMPVVVNTGAFPLLRYEIPIPADFVTDSPLSYTGSLISVAWEVRVKACTPWYYCNPTVTVPVDITNPPDLEPNAPSTPSAPSVPVADAFDPTSDGSSSIPQATAQIHSALSLVRDGATLTNASFILGGVVHGGTRPYSANLVHAVAVNADGGSTASYSTLLSEMAESISDLPILEAYCAIPAFQGTLRSLTPAQFGAIISNVHVLEDRAAACAILGSAMDAQDNSLSAEHIVAAIKTLNVSSVFICDVVNSCIAVCNFESDSSQLLLLAHNLTDSQLLCCTAPGLQALYSTGCARPSTW